MRMVVGFLKDEQDDLLLIIKNKPAWQKGFLNGVGGKVEANEQPKDAMYREFHEEVGNLHVPKDDWYHFMSLYGDKWAVDFFKAETKLDIFSAKANTDEELGVIYIGDLWQAKVIPNLRWLIPMAFGPTIYRPAILKEYNIDEIRMETGCPGL